MIDPLTIGVGALLWAVFRKQSNTEFGKQTPERAEVYRNAMEYCHDPARLTALAADFKKFGLKAEAHCLTMRAKWRGRTPEQKTAHDAIFTKAMASTNAEAIADVAKIFESMTATIKAAQLRERIKSLTAAAEAAAQAATPEVVHEPEVIAKPAETAPAPVANGMSRHTPVPEETESETRPIAQA